MYKVYMNGRKLKVGDGFLFFSYENARAFVRSKIRQLVKKGKLKRDGFGYWDNVSRNPSNCFSSGVFEIRREA